MPWAPLPLDLGGNGLRPIAIEIDDRDGPGAVSRERARDACPDVTRTRHERIATR